MATDGANFPPQSLTHGGTLSVGSGGEKMLEAKSLVKAVVPSTLIENASPGNIQSTRLALHVSLLSEFHSLLMLHFISIPVCSLDCFLG